MYSGLGLLMDVYRPAQPNGIAIVAIQGSGWYSPMRYDAAQLKASREVTSHAERFAAAGYTVFAINHRQAPRFRYPAPIEDAQRAVRFVRFHASDYGITSDRIGAWGSSSGGHLVELLGTMDGKGDPSDSDPVNRLERKGAGGRGVVRARRYAVNVQHDEQAGTRSRRSWASRIRIPRWVLPVRRGLTTLRTGSIVTPHR